MLPPPSDMYVVAPLFGTDAPKLRSLHRRRSTTTILVTSAFYHIATYIQVSQAQTAIMLPPLAAATITHHPSFTSTLRRNPPEVLHRCELSTAPTFHGSDHHARRMHSCSSSTAERSRDAIRSTEACRAISAPVSSSRLNHLHEPPRTASTTIAIIVAPPELDILISRTLIMKLHHDLPLLRRSPSRRRLRSSPAIIILPYAPATSTILTGRAGTTTLPPISPRYYAPPCHLFASRSTRCHVLRARQCSPPPPRQISGAHLTIAAVSCVAPTTLLCHPPYPPPRLPTVIVTPQHNHAIMDRVGPTQPDPTRRPDPTQSCAYHLTRRDDQGGRDSPYVGVPLPSFGPYDDDRG